MENIENVLVRRHCSRILLPPQYSTNNQGNKADAVVDQDKERDAEKQARLQEMTKPLMKQYKQIDSCLESSAKMNMDVSEVFYFAQHAVVYPVAPLIDGETMEVSLMYYYKYGYTYD